MKQAMKYIKRDLPLHLMILPSVLAVFIFSYIPMMGVRIAFQRFIPAKGFFGEQAWIGLDNFRYVLSMPGTYQALRNTLVMASGKIVFNLLVPIIFSLLLSEVRNKTSKRVIQTAVFFPHFLSWVVFSGILMELLSPQYGLVNELIKVLGGEPVFFLSKSELFQPTMILTDVWKNFGFKSVIYLAAILSIDPTLNEAANIDGANRFQQVIHVTLPSIQSTIVLMMVLSLGDVLNAGFDQIFNLMNPMVRDSGDIIDTMVYRMGIVQAQFGPSTAVGLFKSFVSLILISSSYWVANRWFDYRLF